LLLLLGAVAAALLTVSPAATADPTIDSKRAQAQAVLGEIQEMDSRLSKAIEAYNYANIQLDEIDGELTSNARHLVVARSSLKVAQGHIAHRLRTLYIEGGSGGVIEVLLGAQSLDDLLARLDVAEAVGEQDAKILADVKQFRREVTERRERLKDARAAQARVVAERAEQKAWIEGELRERQRLYDSIKEEIVRLEEAERRRQAFLEAQARQRLLAEQQAAAASAAQAQASSTESASTLSSSSFRDPITDDTGAAPPAVYGGVVGIAMQYLGTPYVWGGMSPGGFDCSGFVSYVYGQMGVSLPHHAASQYGYGTPVSRDELQAGDLVFFDGLGHVGIYIGGGQFIHSPHTGDVVKISSLYDGWYDSGWVGGRRIT
jgi:cell wall-associated NlpC family hydrolase